MRFYCLAITINLAAAMCLAGGQSKPASQPASAPASDRDIVIRQPTPASARARIDRFIEHLEQSEAFSTEARTAVKEAWAQQPADAPAEEFMLAGLSMLNPEMHNALQALDRGQYQKADTQLRNLTNADDAYMRIHARALLARSLVEQDRLNSAQHFLKSLAADEQQLHELTFLEAEIDFLLGYTLLLNLEYDAAKEALQHFLKQHPDAPDPLRLPARQMLAELQTRQPESLGEVSDLMHYAGRRLSNQNLDETVRQRQQRIIDLLNEMIEAAEKKEQQNQSQSQNQNPGDQQGQQQQQQGQPSGDPMSPAEQSTLPGGGQEGSQMREPPETNPGEMWGKMRPKQRQQIMQSLRQHFPSHYRALVEQYYNQLAKED